MIREGTYQMPYAYTVEAMVKYPRSVQKKRFAKTGIVELAVPEIRASAAPVVAALEFDHGRAVHEIRYFRGEFYAMACSADHVYPRQRRCEAVSAKRLFAPGRKVREGHLFPYLLVEEVRRTITPPEVKALVSVATLGFHIPEYEDSRVVEIIASSEDRDRELARQAIQQLIVVDGEVWSRIEEPRFVISFPPDIHGRTGGLGTFSAIGYGMPTERAVITLPDELRFYSLRDRDALYAYIESRGRNLAHRLELGALPAIRIDDPTVFTTDWEGFRHRQVLGFAIKAYGDNIGEQSAEFVSAWLACREAAAEYDRMKDRAALIDAISGYIPELVSTCMDDPTSDMRTVAEFAEQYVVQTRDEKAVPIVRGPG